MRTRARARYVCARALLISRLVCGPGATRHTTYSPHHTTYVHCMQHCTLTSYEVFARAEVCTSERTSGWRVVCRLAVSRARDAYPSDQVSTIVSIL